MNNLLQAGWLAGIGFIFGTLLLGNLLTDYNLVSQTVSEIGETGSPLEGTFKLFSFMISILLILFSIGLLAYSRKNSLSLVPGFLLLTFGLAEFGIGLFPSPHPLHNVFGLSLTIGYLSPLFFFFLWKNKLGDRFKWISLLVFLLVLLGIFLNLTPAFAPELYPLKYYGLAQRFLLYTFYGYCAYISISTLQYYAVNKSRTEIPGDASVE